MQTSLGNDHPLGENGESARDTYRIGAVARLTGIPPDTLRAWERRYHVVEPGRADGRFRLYSRQDIARLALIKRLVDAGQAIGSVARLTMEQLQARLNEHTGAAMSAPASAEATRVALLGDALPARVGDLIGQGEGLEMVLVERSPQRFMDGCVGAKPDVIVLEYPAVHPETSAEVNRLLRRCGASHAVVVYGFGARGALQSLRDRRVSLLRAPVDVDELQRVVRARGRVDALILDTEGFLEEPVPRRRLDADTLARIGAASTSIACECPHHLADLISSLTAFEHYSADCESRNREDAALHAKLHATTAHARALLEQLLVEVAQAEGIEI